MKKILITFLILYFMANQAFALTYYASNGSSNCTNNWSSNTCWSVTSGGATAVGPPTASDNAILDSNSPNMTIDTTTDVAASVSAIVGTGNYANTLTFTAAKTLGVSGNVTWVAGMTLAGTGTLKFNANGTYTPAGLTFPGNITNANITLTFAANSPITGTLSSIGSGGTATFAGAYTITAANLQNGGNGNLTFAAGETIAITNSIVMIVGSGASVTMKSGTSSSAFFLNYSGSLANEQIANLAITDCNASGGTTIYNFNGGSLTRDTNVTNQTAANFGSGGSGGFFIQ